MTAAPSSAAGGHRQQQQSHQQQQQQQQQHHPAAGAKKKKTDVQSGAGVQTTLSAASWKHRSSPLKKSDGPSAEPTAATTATIMAVPSSSSSSTSSAPEVFAPQPFRTAEPVLVESHLSLHPIDQAQKPVLQEHHSLAGPEVSQASASPLTQQPKPTLLTTTPVVTRAMSTTPPPNTSSTAKTAKKRRSLEGLGPTQRTTKKDEDGEYFGATTIGGGAGRTVRSSKRRIVPPRAASVGPSKTHSIDNDGNSTDTASLGSASNSNSSGGGAGPNNKRTRDPNTTEQVKKTKVTDHRQAQGLTLLPAVGQKGTSPGLQDERRPPIIKGVVSVTGDEDTLKNNNDYCENCLGLGQFICCDTCPKAFHFSCCNPPLDPDNLPDEWHCNECRARLYPPQPNPNGIFKQLLDNLNCMNPRSFALPMEMRSFFKNVETNSDGEYVDSMEFKPEPTTEAAVAAAAAAQAAEEPFQLWDSKTGEIRLCHHCHKSALNNKMMASCDHCPLHWHLDCLNPPLATPPPSARRWMCPAHIDPLLPRRRKKRDAVPIRLSDPYAPNDGDIEIIEDSDPSPTSTPSPPPQKKPKPTRPLVKAVEMMDSSGVVYRIPEKSIKLNFFQKCQSIRKPTPQLVKDEEERYEESLETSRSSVNMLDILAATTIACDGVPASVAQHPGGEQDPVLRQLTSPEDRSDYLQFRAFQKVMKDKGLEDQVRRWVDDNDQSLVGENSQHQRSGGPSSEASSSQQQQQHQHREQEQQPQSMSLPLPSPQPYQQTQQYQQVQPSSPPLPSHQPYQQHSQQTARPLSPPQEPQQVPRIRIKREKLEELARQRLLPGQDSLSRSTSIVGLGQTSVDQEQPCPPRQQPRESSKDDTSKAKAI